MRILQIINSLGTGGAEKLLLDTIPLYRNKGIEMDVLLLWNNNHQFTKRLQELNCCEVIVLNDSDSLKNIYNPFNILKIREYIKNYDILHVHLFPAQYYVVLANIGVNKKILFTEHNTTNRRISNSIFRGLERVIYNKYLKLICISSEIQNIYDQYLKLYDKTIIIKNGVNLSNIYNSKSLNRSLINTSLTYEDILILQISGFRAQKDQDTLIKSLKHLPERYKVVLVGDGERKMELMKLTKALSLTDRVVFLGQRMDVPQLLKSVDLVCLSTHYEGLSLSSVEGLASGKPFIGSDVPGLRDVIKDAGILFKKGNEVELAKHMKNLMEDKNYYHDVVEKCLDRSKEFDINVMVDQHIDLYKQIYKG